MLAGGWCVQRYAGRKQIAIFRAIPGKMIEESAQLGYVFTMVAQPRNHQRNHREPVVKILAKMPFLYTLF